MATFPDTPDIADALASYESAAIRDLSDLVNAAVARLRQLHQLGAVEEAALTAARAQLATATADLETRTEERDEARTERDALTAQVTARTGERDDAIAGRNHATASLATRTAERDSARAARDALAARLAEYEPSDGGVPVGEFRKRLLPLRLKLLTASDAVRAKWSIILPEIDHYTVIYPRQQPVNGLIDLATADGLVTADEAAALRA